MLTETYAATTVTHARRALFNRTANADLLLHTLLHYRDNGRYQLHAFVIMPEHLHILLTPSEDQTIERCMQCIKGGFSHTIRAQIPGTIWQPSFHAHRIRDAEDYLRQRQYIAHNPEKRGLINHLFVHTNHLPLLDPTPETYIRGSSPTTFPH
jgi:putative transposase